MYIVIIKSIYLRKKLFRGNYCFSLIIIIDAVKYVLFFV